MADAKMVREMTSQELMQVVQNLATKAHQRSEAMALMVLDTLSNWIQMAENPGDPNYLAARNLIQQWVQLHERMRAIASGIQLPKQ